MTPEAARAMYSRQIDQHGETIILRRVGSTDASVKARAAGYRPDELIAPVQQGDTKVIALAEDVETSGFPVPFRERFDHILIGGKDTVIQAVDTMTRRVAGTLVAYEIRVRG